MEQDKKIRLIFAGIILATIIACGVIGYVNSSNTSLANQAKTQTAAASGTAVIELMYCTEVTSLCVVSFGLDNAGNMLIVLKNDSPATEIYGKINQSGAENLYLCQKIGNSLDTYYCLGSQVPDRSKVTLEVYTKGNNVLLASGVLSVQFDATPAVVVTKTPGITVTVKPTQTTAANATKKSPTPVTAYPNATAYPNPTPYP